MYIYFRTYNQTTHNRTFNFKSKNNTINNIVKNTNPRRKTLERNQTIIKLLKQGMTREAVAIKMGLSQDTVKLIANKLGFNCQVGAKTDYMLKIEKRNQQLKELLMQGIAISDITKITGLSETTIRKFVHKLKSEDGDLLLKKYVREPFKLDNGLKFENIDERNKCILSLLKSGVARENVAEIMGLSLTAVRKIAEKFGLNCQKGVITAKMARTQERNARVMRMKELGLSNFEIAQKEGISTMTVSRIFDKIKNEKSNI